MDRLAESDTLYELRAHTEAVAFEAYTVAKANAQGARTETVKAWAALNDTIDLYTAGGVGDEAAEYDLVEHFLAYIDARISQARADAALDKAWDALPHPTALCGPGL